MTMKNSQQYRDVNVSPVLFWRAGLRDQTNGDGVENIRDNTAGLRELFKIDPSGASELVILPMLSYHPFWVAGLPLIVCC